MGAGPSYRPYHMTHNMTGKELICSRDGVAEPARGWEPGLPPQVAVRASRDLHAWLLL